MLVYSSIFTVQIPISPDDFNIHYHWQNRQQGWVFRCSIVLEVTVTVDCLRPQVSPSFRTLTPFFGLPMIPTLGLVLKLCNAMFARSYPELGDVKLKTTLWTFKHWFALKMRLRYGISIVLLLTSSHMAFLGYVAKYNDQALVTRNITWVSTEQKNFSSENFMSKFDVFFQKVFVRSM